MGVPKKRKTKSGTRQRRSHHALSKTQLAKCKNCGAATRPHEVCRNCGYYRGRLVTKVTAKK